MAAKAAPLREGMCRLAGSGSWRLDASQPSLFEVHSKSGWGDNWDF